MDKTFSGAICRCRPSVRCVPLSLCHFCWQVSNSSL